VAIERNRSSERTEGDRSGRRCWRDRGPAL